MSPLEKLRGDRVEPERIAKSEGDRERSAGADNGRRGERVAATERTPSETAKTPL